MKKPRPKQLILYSGEGYKLADFLYTFQRTIRDLMKDDSTQRFQIIVRRVK